MSATNGTSKARFDELKPGDRITIRQTRIEDNPAEAVVTTGTVVRTERARHDGHGEGGMDDESFTDRILLALPDGELTTITVDALTELNRA